MSLTPSSLLRPGNSRSSWDPLTTLYAVRGLQAVGCREEGWGGSNVVTQDGTNWWQDGEGSNQTYLVLEAEPWVVGEAIDHLLCGQDPGHTDMEQL